MRNFLLAGLASFVLCSGCLGPAQKADGPADPATNMVSHVLFDGHVRLLIPELLRHEPALDQPKEDGEEAADVFTAVSANRLARIDVTRTAPRRNVSKFTAPSFPLAAFMMEDIKQEYPTTEWISDDVKVIHGREFVVLEYRADLGGADWRVLMARTTVGQRSVFVALGYPFAESSTWTRLAEETLDSIVVTE